MKSPIMSAHNKFTSLSDATSTVVTKSANTATRQSVQEISDQLNNCRTRIQLKIKVHLQQAPLSVNSLNDSLMTGFQFLKQRAQKYLQNHVESYLQTSISPAAAFQYVTKRPVLVGAAVVMVIMVGPSRVVGWLAKGATLLRLIAITKAS